VLRGLVDATPSVADFVEAGGAAVCLDGKIALLGRTPGEVQVRELTVWLAQRALGDVYATASLARDYAPAAGWADVASGLLAVPISRVNRSFVLWFRPEVARTVNWAGDPHKRVEVRDDGTERLSPRRSFALWQQSVRGESLPWRRAEVEAARDLRQAVVDALLHESEARRDDEVRRVAFERERRIAATLQRSLLTPVPEAGVGGMAVAALYEAAWSEANIGGDFFDAFALPDGRALLAVGDVTGKGLAAAQHIMEAKFALRALAVEHGGDPGACLTRLNALLSTARDGDVTSPVALALAVVDARTGRALVVSAGAEYPLVVRTGPGGAARPLKVGSLALGVLPDERYAAEEVTLGDDEMLVMVTDGITEARAPRRQPGDAPAFLDAEGVVELLATLPLDVSPDAAARAVLDGARRFAGGAFRDDACLLIARRGPGHPAPPRGV
jgi:serine phosphatase RsbU (regulator of sigma subunit)